jgi:hypothetical protein
VDSIVEYATREQAQQAVATLSNQNLMGRLVYVREVRSAGHRLPWYEDPFADGINRTAKRSPDSDLLAAALPVAEASWAVQVVLLLSPEVIMVDSMLVACLVLVAVRSMCPTFVPISHLPIAVGSCALTITAATIHCRLAGSEGSVPAGR